jgi:hypothetical protein
MSALGKLCDISYLEEHFPHLDASEVSQAAEQLDAVAVVSHEEAGVVSKDFQGLMLQREYRNCIMFKRRPVTTSTLLHFAIWFVAEFGVDPELISYLLDSLKDPDDVFIPASYKAGPKTVFVTAVHIAAGLGQVEILQILTRHVCNATSEAKRLTPEEYVNQWALKTGKDAVVTTADYMDPVKRSEYTNFYQPIHDSTFAGYGEVTLWLLGQNAECTRNDTQITPLHFVAFSGITGCLERQVGEDLKKIVRLLYRSSAIPSPLAATCNMKNFIKGGVSLNPLEIAVEDASRFPQEYLGLLAPCLAESSSVTYFDDIKQIADVSAEGALNLVKSIAEMGKKNQHILRQCRINAQMPGASDILASIFYTAPLAASELLELLEVSPEVEDAAHHSIPVRTALWGLIKNVDMRCTYQTEAINKDRLLVPYWEWKTRNVDETKGAEDQSWHSKFLPRPPRASRSSYIKNVKVNVCLLPNVLDIDIIMAFAHCQQANLATMGTKTVQGVICCLWSNLVEMQWSVDVTYRAMDTFAYVALAIIIPSAEGRISLAWTIVAGIALRQFLDIALTHISVARKWSQLHMHNSTLASMWSPTTQWSLQYTIPALIQASLAIIYAIDLSFKDDERTRFDDRLLAVCLLLSCFRLIWAWRLSDAGSTIYTIGETLKAGAGNQMLFITCMLLISFVVALMVLSRLHTVGLAVYTYRGFLFGDGDGFNDIGMDIGHEQGKWDSAMLSFALFGAFFFNVVVLNIIIAIYGHEYERSQSDTPLKFMRGRADYCVKAVLSSYVIPWKGATFNHALTFLSVLMIASAIVMGSSRDYVAFWHMWLSALMLAAGQSLLRMALIQCDWFSPEGQDAEDNHRFLWICHSRDWNSALRSDSGVEEKLEVVQERLQEDMDSVEHHLHKMNGKIEQIFNALHLHDPLKSPSKSPGASKQTSSTKSKTKLAVD